MFLVFYRGVCPTEKRKARCQTPVPLTPGNSQLVDTGFAFSIIDKDWFSEFHKENNDDKCLDIDEKDFRLSDVATRKVIQKISTCENTTEFLALEKKQRDRYIKN
jgi:hypothetical protein